MKFRVKTETVPKTFIITPIVAIEWGDEVTLYIAWLIGGIVFTWTK